MAWTPICELIVLGGWGALVAQRSFCRLRAGLLTLGHKAGYPSAARQVQCVACNGWTQSICSHILLRCARFVDARNRMVEAGVDVTSLSAVLKTQPQEPQFAAVALLAKEIETAAQNFWSEKQ